MLLSNFFAGLFLPSTTLSPALIALHGKELQMRYPRQDWIKPGSILNARDTGPIPEIGTVGLDCNKRYLILSLDLDVILPETGIQTVILHWYQSNLTFDCNGEGDSNVLKPNDDDQPSYTAPYIAPQPPPGTHHRYVFLLFNQSQSYEFPQCYDYLPPQTMEARAGFDIRQFMLAAGLNPPIAINYFFGHRKPNRDENPLPSSSVTQTSFRSVDCSVGPTSL